MRKFRTYHEVTHDTGSRILEQVAAQRTRLTDRLSTVGAVVAVASGKGGVGKSAITANLAAALAGRGARVGALDADLNGPSLGRMLGVARGPLVDGERGVEPATGVADIRVMSMDLLQQDEAPLRWRGPEGDAFVWRGLAETGVLREFLSDVVWGDLDYLLIDVPPGTDRVSRLIELVPQPQQTLLVTTPAEITRFVVTKSAKLLRDAGVQNIAIVANMVTPSDAMGDDPVAALERETGLAVTVRIPYDTALAATTDRGTPIVLASPDTDAARAFARLAECVERGNGGRESA
jgi:ATP-binding protein involved in chromosome partitioning